MLSKEEMKKLIGGVVTQEDLGEGDGIIECSNTCTTTADCPVDRKCASGDCMGKTVLSCFRY